LTWATASAAGGPGRRGKACRTGPVVLLWLAAAVLLPAAAAPAHGAEALPGELRARVERLKTDATRVASNALNGPGRAQTLWRWANARALGGGHLPADLNPLLARILDGSAAAADYPALDRYVAELTLLDEAPFSLPAVTIDAGPFVAGSYDSVQQTLVLGDRPLGPGASLLLARRAGDDLGPWQTSDPGAPGFLSLRSSNARVRFAWRPAAPVAATRQDVPLIRAVITAGTLQPGDRITLTYGDRREGSRGLRLPLRATDRAALPLYLAFRDGGHDYALPSPTFTLVGGPGDGVDLLAPSMVAVNQPFDLRVRARDRYGNRAGQGRPEWQLARNGVVLTQLPAGPDALIRVRELREQSPGVVRFQIQDARGSTLAESNPMLVSASPPAPLLWGDLHGVDPRYQSPAQSLRRAREDAGLDFAAVTGADVTLDDARWDAMGDAVRSVNAGDGLVALLGYRWTGAPSHGGPHTVLLPDALGRQRVGRHNAATLSQLLAQLQRPPQPPGIAVLALPGADSRQFVPGLTSLTLVADSDGLFPWALEQRLRRGTTPGVAGAAGGYGTPGGQLPVSLGHRRSGLTAVQGPLRDSAALLQALRGGGSQATSGDRSLLWLTREPGTPEGAATLRLQARAITTAPVLQATLLRDGEPVLARTPALRRDAGDDGERLLLTLRSPSAPAYAHDAPADPQRWEGSIGVTSASVSTLRALNFDAVDDELEATATGWRIRTRTRGDGRHLLLELDAVRRGTRIELALNGTTASLALRDLKEGQLQGPPGITLQRLVDPVSAAAAREVEFSYAEDAVPPGTVYQLHVRQIDGNEAWSAPLRVGGWPPR